MPEVKKRLLIVCPYPRGVAPSQRLKYEQYFAHFEENGYDITIRPFISENFWEFVYTPGNFFKKFINAFKGYFYRSTLLFSLRKYDLVYIHLWVTPFGPPIFEWLYRTIARKIVYDIDDMVYLKAMSLSGPDFRA